jgi:ribosomal protein S18 acetylase RimI-like enzyme
VSDDRVVRLREPADDELAGYLEHLEADYARQMHELGGVPTEEALARSRASTLELFPDGRPAPGQWFRVATDADGQRVGVLWLARRDGGSAPYGWVYDIEVVPARRGEGWGRALMLAAETVVRDWGLDTLRLNVFGDNEVARSLYTSLGFREQQVTMSKRVGADVRAP